MKIESQRAAIIESLLMTGAFVDDCQVYTFENADGEKLYQGVFTSAEDRNFNVVASLPGSADGCIFLVIADESVSTARRIVSNLEEWSLTGGVSLGNVVLIRDAELLSTGHCGLILLPVSTSNLLDDFPDTIEAGGGSHRLLLAVPLTDQEHRVWKESGHDALMAFFEETGKDVVLGVKEN